jgi:5,10-methylenetetrahydrofolate reductase
MISKKQRGKDVALTVVGSTLAASMIFGLITTVYYVSTEAKQRAEIEHDRKIADATSRITTLYKADGERVEKWYLDVDSGRSMFVGYVPWSEATPPIGR